MGKGKEKWNIVYASDVMIAWFWRGFNKKKQKYTTNNVFYVLVGRWEILKPG